MGRLQGEVALVTGAGRGFGEAIALALAAEGAAVILFARSKDQLDALGQRITEQGGRALAVAGDVTRQADVTRAAAEAKAAFGPVTVLVNNAGVPGPFGPIGVVDVEEWWMAQTIHVKAPFMFMAAALPDMRAMKRGRIINVASLGGTIVRFAMSAYGVGKCAEIRLTEHAALEGKADGIFAFAIHPGLAHTGLADATLNSPDAQKWAPKMIETVKHRQATVDSSVSLARCAEMCVDLASGDYDVLTGKYLIPEDDFAALKKAALASPAP
jgi:NAD(P)-dependent dehydrogenase (short-subunit alcohol dehydrogenase family)